ncbi:DUF4240 domain-containing protein [Psychroserpens algicola]|uniref:DUF4240 domain-containing protein n=1 Tax=Psychroserpens algicola TaxID=1719034 RepID=A0ABT0H3V2_9FLAO|nr:DUF4240 domain-containing protein [Psychroserpens algicola]MCK8479056.1 DUF4240 domain-containing protein [Psychroserpens algicola]
MMEEQQFWDIIDMNLKHHTLEDDIAYDEFLHDQLKKEQVRDVIGFQLRLIELRRVLDSFEVIKTAQELAYYSSREVFNRFCNGIVASGKSFYYKVKDDPEFIKTLLKEEPIKLRYCYYEGFSLIAPNVFHEKEGNDADWVSALKNAQRLSELNNNKGYDSEMDREL